MEINTHISYKTAKALKEFLGDKAPEPMDTTLAYCDGCMELIVSNIPVCPHCASFGGYPAYQLHDLLSKPFCEAMSLKIYGKNIWDLKVFRELSNRYFSGGLPAVEKELLKMMEGK